MNKVDKRTATTGWGGGDKIFVYMYVRTIPNR
jgi:hypothetical protein